MTCRPAGEAGFLSDVLESSVAEIPEQEISNSDRGDKQVRQTVIIDVSKRSGNADLVVQTNSRRGSDVFKLAAPQIPPKLVAPELIDEINIQTAIAVHISNGQASAVIIMNGFVVFGGVIHGMMFKAYATLLVSIGKLE